MKFITSTGVNIHIPRQIPSIFSSIPSLTSIQSDVRTIPVGPLGGKDGIIYEELLDIYIKNNLIDILPKCMNLTEDEYLSLWKACQSEFSVYTTNYKIFRFWAQKL